MTGKTAFFPAKADAFYPFAHFSVDIKRGPRSSAVATAAYNSASVLFSEREQVNKRYTYKSDEVFFSEVLLPSNAPEEFKDREVLWNSVEMFEKQLNAQYARLIKATIPRDISPDEYVNYIREFCNETFVSKGMCCDYAIHDKGDGNPHVHILLTNESHYSYDVTSLTSKIEVIQAMSSNVVKFRPRITA